MQNSSKLLDIKSNQEILRDLDRRLISRPTAAILKEIEIIKEKIGITRVAEIGRFLDNGIHVFQTTRPGLFQHHGLGINTGSQGKGYSPEQAHISAVMEALEAFSMEPRSPHLIFGSFRDLDPYHTILDPNLVSPRKDAQNIKLDERMVWTKSLLFPLGVEVLIPADLVYFIFPSSFGLKSYFGSNSNGLGAGFDYSRALSQGMSELIERHYIYFLERLEIEVEAFEIDHEILKVMSVHSENFLSDYQIQFYAITIPGLKNQLPFIYCMIGNDLDFAVGYGVSPDPVKALEKAHTEAFQCFVTNISGSREDLTNPTELYLDEEKHEKIWPKQRTLNFKKWKNKFKKSSHADYEIYLNWFKHQGFPGVFVTNLTLNGIDVPVVKCFVPGLLLADKYQAKPTSDINSYSKGIRKVTYE